MDCHSFELHIVDEVEGLLEAELSSALHSHKEGCAACTQIYEELRESLRMVRSYMPLVEPPLRLEHKIMAAAGLALAPQTEAAVDAPSPEVRPISTPIPRSMVPEIEQVAPAKGFFQRLAALLASPSFKPAMAFCAVVMVVGSIYLYQYNHQRALFHRQGQDPSLGVQRLKDLPPSKAAPRRGKPTAGTSTDRPQQASAAGGKEKKASGAALPKQGKDLKLDATTPSRRAPEPRVARSVVARRPVARKRKRPKSRTRQRRARRKRRRRGRRSRRSRSLQRSRRARRLARAVRRSFKRHLIRKPPKPARAKKAKKSAKALGAGGGQARKPGLLFAPANRGPTNRGPAKRGPANRSPTKRGPANRAPAKGSGHGFGVDDDSDRNTRYDSSTKTGRPVAPRTRRTVAPTSPTMLRPAPRPAVAPSPPRTPQKAPTPRPTKSLDATLKRPTARRAAPRRRAVVSGLKKAANKAAQAQSPQDNRPQVRRRRESAAPRHNDFAPPPPAIRPRIYRRRRAYRRRRSYHNQQAAPAAPGSTSSYRRRRAFNFRSHRPRNQQRLQRRPRQNAATRLYQKTLKAADKAYQANQRAKALRLYKKALPLAPAAQRNRLYWRLGVLSLHLNQKPQAQSYFRSFIDTTPLARRQQAYRRVTNFYRWKGQRDQAIRMLRRMIKLYPSRAGRYRKELKKLQR